MLDQRRRPWAGGVQMLYKCQIVSTGIAPLHNRPTRQMAPLSSPGGPLTISYLTRLNLVFTENTIHRPIVDSMLFHCVQLLFLKFDGDEKMGFFLFYFKVYM